MEDPSAEAAGVSASATFLVGNDPVVNSIQSSSLGPSAGEEGCTIAGGVGTDERNWVDGDDGGVTLSSVVLTGSAVFTD